MRSKVWGALLLLGGLSLACGDSTGLTEDDLTGTWNATEFVFSDFEDPVTDFHVVPGGGSVTMVIRADGTFTITITLGGLPPDVVNGTWELQGGDVLVITEDGEVDDLALEIELSGTTLTVYSDDVDFDFGDGEIPAQLDATFVKQ
jgi:hypothetical protein